MNSDDQRSSSREGTFTRVRNEIALLCLRKKHVKKRIAQLRQQGLFFVIASPREEIASSSEDRTGAVLWKEPIKMLLGRRGALCQFMGTVLFSDSLQFASPALFPRGWRNDFVTRPFAFE